MIGGAGVATGLAQIETKEEREARMGNQKLTGNGSAYNQAYLDVKDEQIKKLEKAAEINGMTITHINKEIEELREKLSAANKERDLHKARWERLQGYMDGLTKAFSADLKG